MNDKEQLLKLCLNCGRFVSVDGGGNITPHLIHGTNNSCIKPELTIQEFYDYMKLVLDDFAVHWLQSKHEENTKVMSVTEWLVHFDDFIDTKL